MDGHRQFVLSLRWGRVLDRPALLTLLTGSDAAAADARAAAERAADALHAAEAHFMAALRATALRQGGEAAAAPHRRIDARL